MRIDNVDHISNPINRVVKRESSRQPQPRGQFVLADGSQLASQRLDAAFYKYLMDVRASVD